MLRSSLIALALCALSGLAACGGDDGTEGTAKAPTAGAGDVERYCALTRELDAAGAKFFARVERDNNAGPKQFEIAERRFLERFAGKLEEIERNAPRKIGADVRKILASQQQRAGLESDVKIDQSAASAAEERVRVYEKRNCGGR